MSAPPKPWEKPGVNNYNSSSIMSDVPPCCQPGASAMPPGITGGGGALPQTLNSAPPPVPDRPLNNSLNSYGSGMGYGGYGGGYGSYGGMYGGGPGGYGGMSGGMYGGSMYGGGMYGSGMYGSGMYGGAGYGMGNYQPNSFVQQAEASSRQAFESIGSVVQVFGSVAMMLDSTYQAVFNSFRAVIGVADQFGRMKTHIAQIFSALAVIKTLKWFVKKLLVLLRLRPAGLPEDVWKEAVIQEGANVILSEGGSQGKTWPIMMFFAIVFGGPWVIWKLLSSFSNSNPGKWQDGSSDHFLATAEHEFTGQGEHELSFRRGQKIIIAPKELQPKMRGWLLASVDGNKEGIIPANYVKVMGRRKGQQPNPPPPPTAPTQSSQPRPQQQNPPPQQAQFPLLNPAQDNQLYPANDNQENTLEAAFASTSNTVDKPTPSIVDTCEESNEKKCGHCKD